MYRRSGIVVRALDRVAAIWEHLGGGLGACPGIYFSWGAHCICVVGQDGAILPNDPGIDSHLTSTQSLHKQDVRSEKCTNVVMVVAAPRRTNALVNVFIKSKKSKRPISPCDLYTICVSTGREGRRQN